MKISTLPLNITAKGSNEPLMTRREAAEHLGKSESWMGWAYREGVGPKGRKINNQWYYKASDIEDYKTRETQKKQLKGGGRFKPEDQRLDEVIELLRDLLASNEQLAVLGKELLNEVKRKRR